MQAIRTGTRLGWPVMLGVAASGVVVGLVAAMLLRSPEAVAPQEAAGNPPGAAATVVLPNAAALGLSAEEVVARQALLARLRSPDAARLEDVRVWRFGPADERAVCGTLLSPEIAGGSARFVVRVLLARGGGTAAVSQRPPMAILEDGPGLVRPAPEASRRFCRDPDPPMAAVPQAAPAASGAPVAAMPVTGDLITPSATIGAGATQATLPAGAPAAESGPAESGPAVRRGRVLVQSPANMRTAPGGNVVSTIPRGRVLDVYERAPGGWVQVGGEDGPQGWIHMSLLSEAPSTSAD